MPPKKQPKPNAFLLFAMDLQKQQGQKFKSLKDACDGAAPLWAQMNKDKRKPYEDKARQIKGENAPGRYTSEGVLVDELLLKEKQKLAAEEAEKSEVRNILTIAQMKGELASVEFFIIHFNIFCYSVPINRYYPAEISVLRFSLKDGVRQENLFHHIIESGPLPTGYKFEAKQHSESTHQLVIPFDYKSPDNQEEIYYKLKSFLQEKSMAENNKFPILYVDKRYVDMTKGILDTWADEYDDIEGIFKIYSLQNLFHMLRNTVAMESVWPTPTYSERELEKDVYAYVQEIACKFHKATTKPHYCSQSVVTRYAYVICDNCCPDLNIELLPNHHVPLKSSGYERTANSSSYGGSIKNLESNVYYTDLEKDFDNLSVTDYDTESVTSYASDFSNVNMDLQFPLLGQRRLRPQNDSHNEASTSGIRSYAGAALKTSIPSAFQKSSDNVSIHSTSSTLSTSTVVSKGRGFQRRDNPNPKTLPPTESSSQNEPSPDSNTDFPPLGRSRGRGFVPRGVRKPGIPRN